jgi:hypothetical protein
MATATKTRKSQVPANPPEHDEDHPVTSEAPSAPAPRAPRTGNSAYATEEERNTIAELHAKIRAVGYTRPMVSAVTGFNDSTVWRAQNRKAHTDELEAWVKYFEGLPRDKDGEFVPPANSRRGKIKVEELQARVQEALDVLGNEAKTAAQYRKLVEAVQEILADVVPRPEETDVEATATA